jgi:hypothetical protein
MPVFSSVARSRNKSECSMRGVEAGEINSVALNTMGVPYLWEKNTSKPKNISEFTIQTKKGEYIIEDGCIEQVSVGQKYTLFYQEVGMSINSKITMSNKSCKICPLDTAEQVPTVLSST